mmetsp:Transcript_61170/g.169279  ORF Transcript_61170/g.169279 Transcript_61170/m.169279 type:complete len:148 (-) Transcript_61170:158-601(-)
MSSAQGTRGEAAPCDEEALRDLGLQGPKNQTLVESAGLAPAKASGRAATYRMQSLPKSMNMGSEEAAPTVPSKSKADEARRCGTSTEAGDALAGHGVELGDAPAARPNPAASQSEAMVWRNRHLPPCLHPPASQCRQTPTRGVPTAR